MSALARFFNLNGYGVAGYDLTRTALTRKLESEGVEISYSDSVESMPSEFQNQAETLVVYTPAIPTENQILQYFQRNNFEM